MAGDGRKMTDEKTNWQKVEERLYSLLNLKDGWMDGGGMAPSPYTIESAKDVLHHLLEEWSLPLPSVFPTPDGGVQAEWVVNDWSLELKFVPAQPLWMVGSASHQTLDMAEETELGRNQYAEFATWFGKLTIPVTPPPRVES